MPEEYAQTAVDRGLSGIVFTCHSPMPPGWWPEVRMDISELDEYLDLVNRAATRFSGVLDVRVGMEMDFFPGLEGWVESLIERCELHHVLGSVHFFSPEYRERYWHGDVKAFRKQYFEHLAESAETGLFDTLAHPDLVKNMDPLSWRFEEMAGTIAAALDRIAATGVAMELNTSGIHKSLPEFNPGPAMLRMMRERNIPVVLGSDSHVPERVGADFEAALDVLAGAGYRTVSCFRNRQRHEIPIAAAKARLVSRARRAAG